MAVDQHRGVHRAGGGAGDAVDLEPGLFQQAVEHAPGEGAMRAAALEGEVDEDGIALNRPGLLASTWRSFERLGVTGLSPGSWDSDFGAKRSSAAQLRESRPAPRIIAIKFVIDFARVENFEAPNQTPRY